MTRKLFSLAGVLVAVFSFTVGGADVEARHCRGHRHRCCQQFSNNGCQPNANNGYQQTSNYGPAQGTYSTSGTAIDVGPQVPAAQVTAPVPNN